MSADNKRFAIKPIGDVDGSYILSDSERAFDDTVYPNNYEAGFALIAVQAHVQFARDVPHLDHYRERGGGLNPTACLLCPSTEGAE